MTTRDKVISISKSFKRGEFIAECVLDLTLALADEIDRLRDELHAERRGLQLNPGVLMRDVKALKSDPPATPPEQEPDITPAMIEAGMKEIFGYSQIWNSSDETVERIFRAMWAAREK